MRQLKAYSEGQASWRPEGGALGMNEQKSCLVLHANIIALVEKCFHPLMDRVTSREMQTFTMHDRGHGLKVAHLMWHILPASRQETVTPAEIAVLVISAHLHDLGMGLNDEERRTRLLPDSDLWESLDPENSYSKAIAGLSELSKSNSPAEVQSEALFQVLQAQEALLCTDTRRRHATHQRYHEIIRWLERAHQDDPIRIPDIHNSLSFDGDSYEEKLIEVCVSHNQDARVLIDRDPGNPDQWRFPTQYPVGCCLLDTRMAAAALRLADILDFDRERTPAVLFHYLLPRSTDPSENVSAREWSKHLAISNWEKNSDRLVFRARSPNAFVHHTITEFCLAIEDEIARTHSIFGDNDWPFSISTKVEAAIEAAGYRYSPYRFSLDEQRVYGLLMGKGIYSNSLDAVRELIQNAVDACRLRDALMQLYDNSVIPTKEDRIVLTYEEASAAGRPATLHIRDTGVGMDRYIIENYFLKVGRSFYKSADFLQTRSQLHKKRLDFSPIAEFGIGFMSVFMLGDRVEVETAPWSAQTEDNQRRILRVDGVGRLIEVKEFPNLSPPRFYGTRVSINLSSAAGNTPTWEDVESYVRHTCRNLDYTLKLTHVNGTVAKEQIHKAEGLSVPIPLHLKSLAHIIPVDDQDAGVIGQIVLFPGDEGKAAQKAFADETPFRVETERFYRRESYSENGILMRGGFAVGAVPGLARNYSVRPDARIEVRKDSETPNLLPQTNLARSNVIKSTQIEDAIFRAWFEALIGAVKTRNMKSFWDLRIEKKWLSRARWLEKYSLLALYGLAAPSWQATLRGKNKDKMLSTWEAGKGDPLPIHISTMNDELIEIILMHIFPLITKFSVKFKSYYDVEHYVLPPSTADWKEKLDQISSTVLLPDNNKFQFAEYQGELSDVLLCRLSPFFNEKFENELKVFSPDYLTKLRWILISLVSTKATGQQAVLNLEDSELLVKASKLNSEFQIMDGDGKKHYLTQFLSHKSV